MTKIKGIDDFLVAKENENHIPVDDIVAALIKDAKSFEEFINPEHNDAIKRALSIVKLPKEGMARIADILKKKCKININTSHCKLDRDMRCDINKWLNEDPPELKYIFKDMLLRGIVAGIMSQGGTGKSYLELYIVISCVTGQTIFDKFVPSEPMKVMVLFGEDDEPIVWMRFKWVISDLKKQGISINEKLLRENLYIICGTSAPLIHKDYCGNPDITETYIWLRKEVEEFQPSLVIIDPKAQWYGLEENSNDHNTEWVNILKDLTHINGATVLFSHHVTKQDSRLLETTASRGGGALTDNCRWVANMRLIDKSIAKKFGISNPLSYVEFKITKNNYASLMPDSLYFKKIENGLLKLVNLETHKFVDITSILKDIMRQDKFELTVDQLVNKTEGKMVRNQIKRKVVYNISAKEIYGAISNGINEGVFELDMRVKPGGKKQAEYLVLKMNY